MMLNAVSVSARRGAAEGQDVTRLLDAWQGGDPSAFERLAPLLIGDLRRIARSHMRPQAECHTLQPTALVNEAYLRLARRRGTGWESRSHFFAYMATTMRRLLVNHARDRRAGKRGGNATHVAFDESFDRPMESVRRTAESTVDLIDLDRALTGLSAVDARQARIVELRFFGGLTNVEVAEDLGVSTRTVKREWHSARLWLLSMMGKP